MHVLALCRVPSGNSSEFLNRLELILNTLHTQRSEIIICGDINVENLVDNNRKTCLDSQLISYNLPCIVNFPTRIQNNSYQQSKLEMYTFSPLLNGLSDNEDQLLETHHIHLELQNQQPQLIRTDIYSIADFVVKLSYET
jgi:hypothetical protein